MEIQAIFILSDWYSYLLSEKKNKKYFQEYIIALSYREKEWGYEIYSINGDCITVTWNYEIIKKDKFWQFKKYL